LPPDAPKVARMTRRELAKLAPLAAFGLFALPPLQEKLLDRGIRFSDWASQALFRRARLAPTFDDRELVAFEKFPYNGYDAIDPEVDLENWTLTVEGAVAHPGEYR